MLPFGQGMQIPMIGGINGTQMMPQGQMGIPFNINSMGGGQGIPIFGPNGQMMMMQMIPQQLQNSNQNQQIQGQSQSQPPTQTQNQTQAQAQAQAQT
ncbi:MAG: hypothetical protein ACKO96_32640, partial [Flammeovirgaceae bacterium]